jgi:hypothetical protein
MASSSSSFPVTSNIQVFCSTCNIFLCDWNEINNHTHELTFKQRPSQLSYQCEICDLKCYNNRNLLEHKKFKHHQQQQHKSTQCSICNRECYNEKNLIEHHKFKHPILSLHDDDDDGKQQQYLQQIDDDNETVLECNDDDEKQQQQQQFSSSSPHLQQIDDDDEYQFSPSLLSNPHPMNDDDDDGEQQQQQFQQVDDENNSNERPPVIEFQCYQCDTIFQTIFQLRDHRRNCHPDSIYNVHELCDNFECETCTLNAEEQALGGAYRSVIIKPSSRCMSMEQMMLQVTDGIRHVLLHCLRYGENIKASATVAVLMHKINITDGSVEKEDLCHFSCKAISVQSVEDVTDFVDTLYNKLDEHIDKFVRKGSNWIVADVEQIAIRIVRYNILKGASSSASFKIPQFLINKKCIININGTTPNDCFKWAVIVSLHHHEHQQVGSRKDRLNKYRCFESLYNFDNIKFPATVEDIVKFQKVNKNVAINALYYHHSTVNGDDDDEEESASLKIVPLYHPPHSIVVDRKMSHILLIDNHWLPISNLNRLLRVNGKHGAFCYRCLGNFHFKERLERHMVKCYNTTGQKETMPSDLVKKFDDWSKMSSPPFILYADIEALLIPSPNGKILQIHVPYAVGSYLVSHSSLKNETQQQHHQKLKQEVKFNVGFNCVQDFCAYLNELVFIIYNFNKKHCKKPQQRNPCDVDEFNRTTHCKYCNSDFRSDDDDKRKVWHHCHLSGKFIAALCQRCNTRIRQPLCVLPILFHNLKNYDMHALCIEGISQMKGWSLKPIAQTAERYITLTASVQVDKNVITNKPIYFTLRFIDSFQFLTASLDRLVSSLDKSQLQHARNLLERYHGLDDDILFKKGIFPYSYLDNEKKLNEKKIPSVDSFFDVLTNSLHITDEEYERAKKAFIQFQCNDLKDYLLRYLELDCLLLADVFENFRVTSTQRTELDPVNFITLPQYTFAAAFKNCQVDLLQEVDMYQFFEEGIRGGMCFVNTHYTLADDNTAIAYWDQNNLYGNALRQLLPCSNFKWLKCEEFEVIDWYNIDVEGDYGYTVKCDLQYPAYIHDKTQDFPLAPESAFITSDMLTPFMEEQWSRRCELRGEASDKMFKTEKKLLMTVTDKNEYVVHFKLLQFYLKMGMVITKIHSVVKYKQASIFRNYIDVNSALRQEAKCTFIKDLYKLLNNALFGKTMENVRGRKDFKLVNNEPSFLKLTSMPNFLCAHHFSKDLILSEMTKYEVTLDKPIFIGQTVLDLSKLIMYDLRYNKLTTYEAEFGGKIRVLGGDTDSLICAIDSINLHQQLHPAMLRDKLLDTSNYPINHPLFTNDFKAKLGCIKDEVEGQTIIESVLLKPKAYSLKTSSNKTDKKTAKGVQYCVRRAIPHDDYVNVYKTQEEVTKRVRRFQSKDHIVYTIEQQKWALSITDTKRAWIKLNYSLPFGHYKINNDDDDDEPISKRVRM